MHSFRRIAAMAGVIALILVGSLASAHNALASSPVVGHVYINDNSTSNAIAGFDRHADGSLTPIPGSPFAAGGMGAADASQGAIQFSGDGRYLLAVDAGSNQISVLRIQPDGSLRLIPEGIVWSGGNQPVSIAVHGNLVYVANQADTPDLTGFTLNPGGILSPLAHSTVWLPNGSNPGDVLFNATGTVLAATLVGQDTGPSPIDGAIASYSVGSDGRLTAAAGSPFPAQANGPFGSKFRPTNPYQLFVSNAHGGAGAGTISAYSVGGDGTLNAINGSPFADSQTAPCWVEITHNGQYLFAVNTASSSISSFSIAADGSLSLIGSTTLSSGEKGALDAGVDPTDSFLYVVERGSNAVAGLKVNGDGGLTELPSSPTFLPSGSTAFGIAVN